MYALMEINVILSVNLFEDALCKSVRSLAFNERLNTNKNLSGNCLNQYKVFL